MWIYEKASRKSIHGIVTSKQDMALREFCIEVGIVNKANSLVVDTLKAGETLAKSHSVTFSIEPTNPNPGYGYICPGERIGNGYLVQEVQGEARPCNSD